MHAKQVPNTNNIHSTTGTRKNPIQLGTCLELLNEVMHKDISLEKDLYASVKIMKSPFIVGWTTLGNIGVKWKSFIKNNGMV